MKGGRRERSLGTKCVDYTKLTFPPQKERGGVYESKALKLRAKRGQQMEIEIDVCCLKTLQVTPSRGIHSETDLDGYDAFLKPGPTMAISIVSQRGSCRQLYPVLGSLVLESTMYPDDRGSLCCFGDSGYVLEPLWHYFFWRCYR